MLKWLWLSVLVVVLDQLTKWWASSELTLYLPVPVVSSETTIRSPLLRST